MRLQDIPVRSVNADDAMGGIGNVQAILSEVANLMKALLESGATGRIDLRSLPLSDKEQEQLKTLLGTGEVLAELQVQGPSLVRETAFHGVWWITHCDPSGETIAELIEVTLVPDILTTHLDDVRADVRRLSATIQSEGPEP